jgi:hypothetical protein
MDNDNKSDAILNAIPWRCFHCDFITSDPLEAAAHFGDRDDAEEFKPLCNWWQRLAADERIATLQDTVKQLNAERSANDRQRVAIEGLEYQVDAIEASIKSYAPFRQCRTIYDVFCVYDSMEGRALAAEERLKESAIKD